MTSPPDTDRTVALDTATAPVADPVETTSSYIRLQNAAEKLGLDIYGSLHPSHAEMSRFPGASWPVDAAPSTQHGTLILLGTAPSFWTHFGGSPEAQDGATDPVDRWSRRVITALAAAWQATPAFPFTGPPYAPFVDWALATGRCFTSPSQMLVHDRYGMMISFRGALYFTTPFDLPPPPRAEAPCLTCDTRPCVTTCPVAALNDGGPYDLEACHDHLDSPEGTSCLSAGCLARRACPLSAGADRLPAQTAHHMRYFHIK
ncbi:hypothetical protein [Phaeobacter gallaeciensis]|uniref:Ferredoxin n=1 Tax=Phaeobacter gallaeciensis TaxID=60890 RepID=A0AAC9Z579_9RHOB|nr:hypothetical protein [Phaeobacter gallaeciensis]AHD08137.1 hypothetical protein Gal_00339 [Phaeobacter gallaeciensis DSM 26640]ATE91403.1 hypothetical protein PhaeoP11_00336 [Phaeobacter gallaeciensis]ATE95679.1 hypothetical protein PhaeoP73_00337 [Phaeobacter gallaeciensis]ATF00019.1 hypothetical protein PhaeoP75_00337 [Phaeobacter gallaeciensis]ATF04451.1 hypothetical protein PhaeoP63_00337 [Phaeobacter gallaeciensis]